MMSATDLTRLRRAIFRWYGRNHRSFPWRRTRDPYRVLVSEVMLQQTQVSRVAEHYPRFMKKFPDILSLARAPKSDVIRAWKGMGYNNRAVRLHGAVREVVASYGGALPGETEKLAALPGVGRYTANAVACFAHGKVLPVVDVNVRRVLSRIFRAMKTTTGTIPERDAWETARRILPAAAYDWNQALMDLGSTVCTARAPHCAACPVSGMCLSSAYLRNGRTTSSGSGRIGAGRTLTRGASGRRTCKQAEPSHRGIPRRVWRGRIVEALRRSRRPLDAHALPGLVRPSAKTPSPKWLNEVLSLLERDGVVTLRRTRTGTMVELAR